MRILLFGRNGQVGTELCKVLPALGELIALDCSDNDQLCADFTDPEGLAHTVQTVQPDVIINAAAYTAVDRAESEPNLAFAINAVAPQVLAAEATKLGAWLVHYSTDYVFDGSGDRPKTEDDLPGPLSVYGQSKLLGEEAVEAVARNHLILRTSWVYAAHGHNFLLTMRQLMRERDVLQVVDDQVGAPTSARLLAEITAAMLPLVRDDGMPGGLYHLTSRGETSWHGFAEVIAHKLRASGEPLAVQQIRPIPTANWPTAARRPLNSRLDCSKLERTFGIQLPRWQDDLDSVIGELVGRAQA